MGIRTRALELTAKSLASTVPGLFADVRNPHFFIGCGRSGTTMLARLLSAHPEIAVYPYEANELWHPRSFPWYRTERKTLPIWLEPYSFTGTSLAQRTPADDRRLMATFGAFQRIVGGRCFLNKSVLVTFMIRKITELFPDARFLHVCRDGRAVAVSFAHKEARRIESFPRPYEERGIRFAFDALLDKFALHWQAHVLEVDAQKRNDVLVENVNLHELSYENLCADPLRELSRIAAFLGVDSSPFRKLPLESISSMNHKHRAELDEQTLARLSHLIRPALEVKGYEASPAISPRGNGG